MYLNYRGIVRVTAVFYVLFGLFLMVPAFVGILYGEIKSVYAFLAVALPLIISGIALFKGLRPSYKAFRSRDGFLIVGIAWLSAALFGALPFIISGVTNNFFDALFESCSGFSTTGSTIFADVESLPKAILFWRCFTHFLGGLGILYMVIALFPALGIDGQTIARSELTGPTFSKLTPKTSSTSRLLFSVYMILTAIEVILLLLGGMNLFDAVTHAFSTMGTGGMSNYNDSVAHFNSGYIETIITLFMLLAGINFNLYYLGIVKGIKEFITDKELQVYLAIVFIVGGSISIYNYITGFYSSIYESIRYAFFNVISLITTTGFCTTNFDLWDSFPIMLLFCLMFSGGCASSTAGGIKVSRLIVLSKVIRRGVLVRLHPNAVVKIDMNGKVLSIDTVESVTGFVFTYVSTIFISTALISIGGYDLTTSFTAAAASLGNIGPGFNQVGPVMNYAFFSDFAKFVLSFLMLAGRLEIFTFFMLFSRKFWNPDRKL